MSGAGPPLASSGEPWRGFEPQRREDAKKASMDADPDLAPLASLRLILLAIQRQERIRAMDPMPSEKSAEAISGPPSSGDGEAYGIPIDGVQHQGGRKMRPRKISVADRAGIGAGIRSCCWLGCRTIMKTPSPLGERGQGVRVFARTRAKTSCAARLGRG